MNDSTPVVNDPIQKTVEANLAEAKQAIESIEAQLLEVKSCIRSVEAVQDPPISKEQVTKMLREAYNLGATAHEENMDVRTNSWSDGIEVHVEMEEGGFRYYGDVNVNADAIKEAIEFNDHNITDEQVEEIIARQTQS